MTRQAGGTLVGVLLLLAAVVYFAQDTVARALRVAGDDHYSAAVTLGLLVALVVLIGATLAGAKNPVAWAVIALAVIIVAGWAWPDAPGIRDALGIVPDLTKPLAQKLGGGR